MSLRFGYRSKMRSILLVAICLALLSMSNQSLLSFGEFIEGHERPSDPKLFRVEVGSTDRKFDLLIGSIKVLIRSKDEKGMGMKSPCGTCVFIVGGKNKQPDCRLNKCTENELYVHNFVKDVCFFDPATTAPFLWKQEALASIRLRSNGKYITFFRDG